MNYWEPLHEEKAEGFDIITSIQPEIMHPSESFDSSSFADDDGLQKLIEAIDNGSLQWFVVRVQAFKNGILLASDYLGGNCYENPSDFITEGGYYEDMRWTVINEANEAIKTLTGEELA